MFGNPWTLTEPGWDCLAGPGSGFGYAGSSSTLGSSRFKIGHVFLWQVVGPHNLSKKRKKKPSIDGYRDSIYTYTQRKRK